MKPQRSGNARWLSARVEQVPYEGHGNEPNVFIQWKGTDVCLDFWCDCGAGGHFDGDFAYALRCGNCGAVWAMPATVYPRKLTDDEIASWPSAEPVDVDMDRPADGGSEAEHAGAHDATSGEVGQK